MINRKIAGLSALALTAAAAVSAPALAAGQANEREAAVEVGVLTCDLTAKDNDIIRAKTEYVCSLDAQDDQFDGTYVANITKWGVDLSTTDQEVIKWAVLTTQEKFNPTMMDGEYVGASADVSVAYGAGVRVLVGGESDAISLQPLSVSGKEGYGLAVGLESMELRAVDPS
ncbi:DUF992 domain-containing protein [Albimonas pacifica]|uniref:DUF992 domain-containing protein n=1 Tax=Albimonas pacifica TaxID=1114924 RepID=A0A1I3PE28_9RHOB|nr:DUF992 domain-containing protein [Albimonas pacifica]SFJ19619.1 Protein of unknown function [Albimonas pacifica]